MRPKKGRSVQVFTKKEVGPGSAPNPLANSAAAFVFNVQHELRDVSIVSMGSLGKNNLIKRCNTHLAVKTPKPLHTVIESSTSHVGINWVPTWAKFWAKYASLFS